MPPPVLNAPPYYREAYGVDVYVVQGTAEEQLLLMLPPC